MDVKEIKIRKSANTLTGLVITLLIIMGLFFGMFLYWDWNAGDSGVVMDSKYEYTYQNLTSSQDSLSDKVDSIKTSFKDVKEADSTWEIAWNGLKGLGKMLVLPINFVDSGLETYYVLESSLDFIPRWAKTIFVLGITALIVFLIVSLLKGEPKM